jgi:cytochrome bd-type quinol oxidase subunit 2
MHSVGLIHLSHFAAMLLFALLVSVALACVTRRTTRERIRYAAWSFAMFALVSVGIAWLMYPFSH